MWHLLITVIFTSQLLCKCHIFLTLQKVLRSTKKKTLVDVLSRKTLDWLSKALNNLLAKNRRKKNPACLFDYIKVKSLLSFLVGRDSLNGKNSSSPSFIPVPKAHKGTITIGSIDPTSETTKTLVCSYHDVVVSRPPSPVKETMRCDPEGLDLVSAGILLPVVQNDNDDTSNSSDSEGDTQYPWTLVQRRCTCSLDSANSTDAHVA